MAGVNLRSITTNGDYYRKLFRLFCERCKKAEVDRAWAENVFPSVVIDKLPQLSENETFRSLGIGSGTGDFEYAMLRQLPGRYSRIHHTVVEPAKTFVQQYQAMIARTGDDVKGVTFDWREQSMQEFQKYFEGNDSNFHFISAVHSMYYADDLTETLRFFLDALKEDGLLLVAVTTDDSSNSKFINRFPVIRAHNPHVSLTNSAHLKASLRALDRPYAVHTQASALDIADVFRASSKEGNSLLDFLTHTINFRRTAPPSLISKILEYLGSDECCQVDEDGVVLFKNSWDTFVIHKQRSK